MNSESNIKSIIEDILSDLKKKIDNELLNDTDANQQLNNEFMKMLDDSSSYDSSDDETIKIDIKKPHNNDDTDDEEEDTFKLRNQKYLKTKDELTIEDFGPVEYFEVHLDANVKLERIGKVISKVDNKLVVIQSSKECLDQKPPTLDEETYLFDSNRNFIGKIFETFGPVVNPFYVVRFNNLNDIDNRNLCLDINSEVFIAQSNQYTKYVFNIDALRKQKGSDASWSNDNEPPVECLDYSDDEQEKMAKKQLKVAKTKIVSDYSDSDSETKKSPQKIIKKSNSNNQAQKRRHDQKHVNPNAYPNQPSLPNTYYYPGAMYPPHPYPFYPNPQMYNFAYPPHMYPPNFNYYQYPMPNQQNSQILDKNFVKNNNPNVVKKKF